MSAKEVLGSFYELYLRIRSGHTLLWVQTPDFYRAISYIRHIGTLLGCNVHVWRPNFKDPDPLVPLRKCREDKGKSVRQISVLVHYHHYLNDPLIQHALLELKTGPGWLIIVSPPGKQIPPELAPFTFVFTPAPPDEQELLEALEDVNSLPVDKEEAVRTLLGLGREDAIRSAAYAQLVSRNGTQFMNTIRQERLHLVKRTALLEIISPVPPEELGGMEYLKKYLSFRRTALIDYDKPPLRGILLLGIPGCGKSLSAKVAGAVFNVPTVRLEMGRLKSSLVGDSERRMNEALATIDRISPVVVWIDEIEKALGGVLSSAYTDGGTTSNMVGSLLTWMEESKTRHYLIGTCNDINELRLISTGALLRRFDDIFFVNVPSENERRTIFNLKLKKYNVPAPEPNFANELIRKTEGWTGAELEKLVIAAAYEGWETAYTGIKPVLWQLTPQAFRGLWEWSEKYARAANEGTPMRRLAQHFQRGMVWDRRTS